MRWFPLLLVGAACAGDAGSDPVAGDPICDGRLQDGEEYVDGPWDRDGDGHYDEDEADCRAAYAENRLDCDDSDPSVNADRLEVACNGFDDDCNSDTPDEIDYDEDGVAACDDCDDDSQLRSPLNEEICWDGIDNNCDGAREEDCPPDYNGVFQLSEVVKHTCSLGLVSIDFGQVGVLYNPPGASVYSVGGSQPGTMDGTIEADGSFSMRREIVFGMFGYCDEYYTLEGRFVDANRFEGTFTAHFEGTCLGCAGTRVWEDLEGLRVLAP